MLGGICLAAWVASGQTTWMPSTGNLVFTLVPIALALAACVLIPDPEYYDEGDFEAE